MTEGKKMKDSLKMLIKNILKTYEVFAQITQIQLFHAKK